MIHKYNIFVIVLLGFFFSGCKESEKSKKAVKSKKNTAVNVMKHDSGEELMSKDDHPLPIKRKKRKPNPRIKAKPFKLFHLTSKPLPKSDFRPILIEAGRFSKSKKMILAYIGVKKVAFLDKKGKIIATTDAPSSPWISKKLKIKNREVLLVAWGRGRKAKASNVSLIKYELKGKKIVSEVLTEAKSLRPDPQDIYIDEGGNIFFAYFVTKYKVAVAKFTPPYKKHVVMDEINMVTKLSSINYAKKNFVVVGRLYGDLPGADGDISLLLDKNKKLMLPSHRGLRSLLKADLDGKKGYELYMGDGWNKNYGKIATANLSVITFDKDKPKLKIVDNLKDDFSILHLRLGDLDGDGKNELIGKGNNSLVAWFPSKKWKRVNLGNVHGYNTFTTADLNGDKKWEIIITKPSPQILSYRK